MKVMLGNCAGILRAMRWSATSVSSKDVPTAAFKPKSVTNGEQIPLPVGWNRTTA